MNIINLKFYLKKKKKYYQILKPKIKKKKS